MTKPERRTWAALTFCLFLAATLATAGAFAQGKPPPPPKPQKPTAQATATAGALAAAEASSEIDLEVLNDIRILPGDPITVEGDEFVDQSAVIVTTDNPRQAPPVYAPSLNNTAPYLKCIGIGASGASGGDAGGGAVGWCWIQRDAYASAQFDRLAAMCMPAQAAQAYCRQKLHWEPHGSKSQCVDDMSSAVEEACRPPEPPQPPPPPNQCEEKLERCEQHAAK